MNHKCFDGFIIALIVLGLAAIGITIAKQNMDESPIATAPVEALPGQPNLVTSTSTPTTPSITIRPGQKTLRVGQSFIYNGTKVTFIDVVGDSRCPANANCIWAGEFSARLTLEKNNDLELLLIKDTATSSSLLYNIGITGVKPHQVLDKTIADKEYTVTFLIELKK